MSTIINLIILLVFTLYAITIFRPSFSNKLIFDLPDKVGYSYKMNAQMYFLTFIVCTAPVFLGQFSLLKYGVYFVILIYLLVTKRIKLKADLIVSSYLIFYLWLIITCFYADITIDTFTLLIKYLIPILSLWLGYSAIESHYDLFYFTKATVKTCAIYGFLIGGFSAVFMPWLYYSPFGNGIFLTYAGLADYFTSLFVVPLVWYWITGKKIGLWIAGWLLLSTILESVRTGLGGIALVSCFFAFFRYKLKSIPFIVVLVAGFTASILFIPSINEKFFGTNAGRVNAKDILVGDGLQLNNIQTSGREFMWNLCFQKYYEENPVFGVGLGTVTRFMKDRAIRENTVALIHSDYVQLLCDCGNISIILLVFFSLCVIVKVFYYTWVVHSNIWIVVSGIMAISSLAGVAFSMGFDNVVSHSMTSLINPFIFIGFFLKFIDLAKDGQLSQQ